MATSRRRERELARRRYERRRQLEAARRARAKRRNTIAGAVGGTVVVLGLLIWGAVALFGGSSGKQAKAAVSPAASPGASTSPSASAAAAPTKCARISPNPPAKGQPSIPNVKGKPPAKLVVKDITVGHGRAAKQGDAVSVTYVGVACSTGKVFDASYLHPPVKPFQVKPLGQASVIQGWNQGLVGIKPGGVRELVIPASLGYGAAGSPPSIKPNETLIFLVTAKSVTQ